ncbi:MAG: diguanylate cyclase [Glaciecola sp.]
MPKHNTVLQSVEWLNGVVDTLEIGVMVVDKSFKVEAWNQFMENHSQVTANDIVGSSIFSHFPALQEDWLRRKCNPVFALATPVFMIWEQRHYLLKFEASRPVTSNADYMFQNITITPMFDEQGDVVKLCFMIYDVTDQALSKLRIEKLNDRLEKISRVDGLTGLFNRRYWQERFEHDFKLSKRNKSVYSLLMLDIDHFKNVNDTYGHQMGDEVIKHLAKVISIAIRETDVAGRYGGEEFVIMLPDTPASQAVNVAERIRKSLLDAVVKYEVHEVIYTCSIGVAELSLNHKRSNMWIEAADQALYQAKENGRNQVVVAK